MKKDDSQNDFQFGERRISRREVLRIAIMTGAPLLLSSILGCSKLLTGSGLLANPELSRKTAGRGPGPLPQPVLNQRSVEICLNSRISYHAGWSGTASDQMLSNVLAACRKSPVTSGPVTVYVATPDNVYAYDPIGHALNLHLAGNHRGDSNSAFQLGFAGATVFDASVAQHLSQVASVALWNGTSSQLGSCPRSSDTTYANSNWSPTQTIRTAISFGIRTVPGFKTTLKAVSSDGSLPNPSTDGLVYFDTAVNAIKYGNKFETTNLSLQQLSQLLWGAYGCSAHTTTNNRAGLTVASAVANYYLTKRVYMVSHMGVHRFHNRTGAGTDLATSDHRIELLSGTDVRTTLRDSITGLPSAPAYFVFCLDTSQVTSSWALTEVGYCAGSILVQATSMSLNTHFRTEFSSGERSTIQSITGIPSADVPIAIVSSGYPRKTSDLIISGPLTPDKAIPNPH